jgi:putative flippase GtrA
MLRRDLLARWLSPEVVTFLAVGGIGYVVDVGAFNLLRSVPVFGRHDPAIAKTAAVCLAMAFTYVGNSAVTWRGSASADRRRGVLLFVLFNTLGLGFSIVTLFVSHHLLGLTSGLADNVSANIVGIGLGTLFRFWSYRRFVFTARDRVEPGSGQPVPAG